MMTLLMENNGFAGFISVLFPPDLAQKQWLHISSDLAQPLEFGFEVFGLQ